jgi:hypothetical protein
VHRFEWVRRHIADDSAGYRLHNSEGHTQALRAPYPLTTRKDGSPWWEITDNTIFATQPATQFRRTTLEIYPKRGAVSLKVLRIWRSRISTR